MLIRRCAWHRTYYGYPMAIGIASWRGRHVSFTDGMCAGCAVRFRRQWSLPDLTTAVVPLRAPAVGLVRVAATLVAVVGVILAAQPLQGVRTPTMVTAGPETVLVPAPPIDGGSVTAPTLPTVPQSPGVVPPRVVHRSSRSVVAAVAPSRPPVKPHSVAIVVDSPVVAVTTVGVIEPPETPRIQAGKLFAQLPHAGLAQQTP